jgi:hypothetical protein
MEQDLLQAGQPMARASYLFSVFWRVSNSCGMSDTPKPNDDRFVYGLLRSHKQVSAVREQ